MAEKDKNTPEVAADDLADAPARDPGETDTAAPDDAPESAVEAEEISSSEKSPGRKISRKDLIKRMAEKNELNALLTQKNSELETKLKETNEKWLRAAADFENYRKRTRKEWDLLKHQSKAEVILEILNVIDDFERAFSAAEGMDSSGFVEGFRLIHSNLAQRLEKIGVKELEALQQPFDPNFHMAVGQTERDDLDSGVIAEVVQKGYLLDGTVIRPANVIVAK